MQTSVCLSFCMVFLMSSIPRGHLADESDFLGVPRVPREGRQVLQKKYDYLIRRSEAFDFPFDTLAKTLLGTICCK